MSETRIGWYNSRLWRHHSFRRVACAPNHAPPSPTAPMTARRKRSSQASFICSTQQLRHWPAESAGQAKRAGDTKGLIGPAQPVWVSTGAPREHPQLREPLAAVASRFIGTGIVGHGRAQRQALGRRQARRRASPHSQGTPHSRGFLRPSSGQTGPEKGRKSFLVSIRRPPFVYKVEATSAGGGQTCADRAA